MRFLGDLSDSFEYGFLWVGQDNARGWGSKSEAFGQSPHLSLDPNGLDLVNIYIATGENTGSGKVLDVDTTLVPNDWVGAELRLGTTAAPLGGLATVTANTANTITVNWSTAATVTGYQWGYLVREDDRGNEYPQVRILTPYQPEPSTASSSVAYPTGTVRAPGFTVPSTITSYEDLGIFLPLSFKEGIDSHGICEATDSYSSPVAHPPHAVAATAATATTFVLAAGGGANLVVNSFCNGFIRVSHGGGGSWARIATNTADTFTLAAAGWQGDGTPTGTTSTWTFEAWVPHYNNSPHAYTPGVGFRYPNNEMMPAWEGNGVIHCRPRNRLTNSYGDRFGAMVEFGWRMAAKLGRRVNIIHLGVNGATLVPNPGVNAEGFLGTLGWWDYTKCGDWHPSTSGGLAARVKKLVQTIAPAAITAEGGNPLRILGIVNASGEEDAVSAVGRESYVRAQRTFHDWLRDVVGDSGLSPYATEADIPIVQPGLTSSPWEDTGYDTASVVNNAIARYAAADAFAETVSTEDSPKLTGDSEHFSGVGEALNGALVAGAMDGLVEDALSFGSAVLQTSDDEVIDLCNLALSHIGATAKVTAIDPPDGSTEASLCQRFYPSSRDSLLQLRQWGFALRRVALTTAHASPPNPWAYAYIVPGDALNVIAVLPPDAEDDYAQAYAPTGIDNLPVPDGSVTYTPQPFAIEYSSDGYRVLYTDQEDAVLRYTAKVVDASRYSSLFKIALSWHLAAHLAGAIIKGEAGAIEAKRCLVMADGYVSSASGSDARQRQIRPEHNVPWLTGR